MSIAEICLFLHLVWLIANKWPVMKAMARQPEGYDNHHPRAQMATLTGRAARAHAAHQNGFEAFVMFLGGYFLASESAAAQIFIDGLCLLHLTSRLAYTLCYWWDKARLRTQLWAVGYLCTLALALLPLAA
jgi:uncharacterized MAPEG superfamily protein